MQIKIVFLILFNSTSFSSGDSDLDDLEDRVDGRYDNRNNVTATGYRVLNADKASPLRYNQQHHRSSSTHASSSTRAHSSKSHTAPIPGLIVHDGSEGLQGGNIRNGAAHDYSGSSSGIADIYRQNAQNRLVIEIDNILYNILYLKNKNTLSYKPFTKQISKGFV